MKCVTYVSGIKRNLCVGKLKAENLGLEPSGSRLLLSRVIIGAKTKVNKADDIPCPESYWQA
jgi:hypothetical protein